MARDAATLLLPERLADPRAPDEGRPARGRTVGLARRRCQDDGMR